MTEVPKARRKPLRWPGVSPQVNAGDRGPRPYWSPPAVHLLSAPSAWSYYELPGEWPHLAFRFEPPRDYSRVVG